MQPPRIPLSTPPPPPPPPTPHTHPPPEHLDSLCLAKEVRSPQMLTSLCVPSNTEGVCF